MTSMEELLGRLNPKVAKAFQQAATIETQYLATPSLGINMTIGGGIRYGGFTVLYGNRGCGKSTMALQMVAEAQRNGKLCAWVDVEKNFNPTWAKRLGVDVDNLIVANKIISIADASNAGRDLISAGVDLIVYDSISQLMPQSYFEDAKAGTFEIKDLQGVQQIGTYSKNMGQMTNILNGVNEKTAIIYISQVRTDINSYGAPLTFMGGRATEHAASTIIRLQRAASKAIESNVERGDILVKENVGTAIDWRIDKNRGPGMQQTGTYDLYTSGDTVGVDLLGEIADNAIKFRLVKVAGSWITIDDTTKVQGRNQLVEFLADNPELAREYYDKIVGAYNV